MFDKKRILTLLKSTKHLYQDFVFEEAGRKMYVSYSESLGLKPEWDALPARERKAWKASAKAVVNELLSLVRGPNLD